MLGDIRVGPFLHTVPSTASWRNESTDRQKLLSRFAVGETRVGRLQRACGYLEHILSEDARVEALIDVALTAQAASITEDGRVR